MRLLLLSGGIDSSAIAWWHRPDLCVTVDYGQAAALGEATAAAEICRVAGLRHEVLTIGIGHLGSGLMSGANSSGLGRPAEWWPYRNQMLITAAAMRHVPHGLKEILIGAVATDVHRDGKPAFIRAMNTTMRLQEGGVRVTAPGLRHTPDELLALSGFPGDFLGLTFSCHAAPLPCGRCAGCAKQVDFLHRYAPVA